MKDEDICFGFLDFILKGTFYIKISLRVRSTIEIIAILDLRRLCYEENKKNIIIIIDYFYSN